MRSVLDRAGFMTQIISGLVASDGKVIAIEKMPAIGAYVLTIEKETGRLLRGKKLSVLASYTTFLPEGFELAFSQTCKHMGIDCSGCFFFYSGEDKILMQKNVTIPEFRSRVLGYG